MKLRLKFISPLLLTQLLFGCAAPAGHIRAGDPSVISIGMTKEQVIKKLGKPEIITADGKSEMLSYILERPWWQEAAQVFFCKML